MPLVHLLYVSLVYMNSSQTRPLVSVIIPCYNHGRYLPEAVASVVSQTIGAWEIIIVDDGSSDDTPAVARKLIARYSGRPLRLITQRNRGPGASRNAGIAASAAPYILPLDADDLVAPTMLERTVAVLEARPEVGFVTTDVRFFGAETGGWSGGEPTQERLIYDCRMVVTTLFRREAWRRAGGFNEQRALQGYEDWDFWLRLAEQGWLGSRVPESLMWYRRFPGSVLSRAQRNDLLYRAQAAFDHPALYPAHFRAWAASTLASLAVAADTASLGSVRAQHCLLLAVARWWRAFLWYVALVAYYAPREAPKALLRPLYKQFGPSAQMRLRRIARLLGISKAR